MRWFRCFAVPKKKKEDTTNGTDQHTADPNQSIRHEEFLSGLRVASQSSMHEV